MTNDTSTPRSTREVCGMVRATEVQVADVIRKGEIDAPRVCGGTRIWMPDDIEALRAALAHRAARRRKSATRRPEIREC